jgi:hypothetical protein
MFFTANSIEDYCPLNNRIKPVHGMSCSFFSDDFDEAPKKKFVLQFRRLCVHYHSVFVYMHTKLWRNEQQQY